MANEDPYSRLYWRLADEYPDVWDDDHALAAYFRLLVSADGAWPSAAATPVGVPVKAWRLLVGTGLVIPEASGKRYRIKGLDKHRSARSDAARNAAGKRWRNANGSAAGSAPASDVAMHIPRRDETRRDEPKVLLGNTTPLGVTTGARPVARDTRS